MKQTKVVSWAWTIVAASTVAAPVAANGLGEVHGDYLEARTSDVYTGPCFANGEVGLTGREAVMAWRIQGGQWEGVDLSGLSVVAVVKASATLGDPYSSPHPAQAVLIVDEAATVEQRTALAHFARARAGSLLDDVVATHAARVDAFFGAPGQASVLIPGLVDVRTRPIGHHDHLCGNEFVYYPPLSPVTDPVPAYTLANRFEGDEFRSTWSSPLKRSAFVASFSALEAEAVD